MRLNHHRLWELQKKNHYLTLFFLICFSIVILLILNRWTMVILFAFHFTGTDVVIVKSGRRICGTGGCLANAPLHQNKSYFEFKIQSTGE